LFDKISLLNYNKLTKTGEEMIDREGAIKKLSKVVSDIKNIEPMVTDATMRESLLEVVNLAKS
jgi:hypothetical protein